MIHSFEGLLKSIPCLCPSFLGQAEGAASSAATGSIGLTHYLVVSALAFSLGITIIVVRRNAIAVLMGIELLMNAAGLNFVAFAKYSNVKGGAVDGQVVTVFIIVIAAAEAALALAIILNIFSNTNTIEVNEADALKG